MWNLGRLCFALPGVEFAPSPVPTRDENQTPYSETMNGKSRRVTENLILERKQCMEEKREMETWNGRQMKRQPCKDQEWIEMVTTTQTREHKRLSRALEYVQQSASRKAWVRKSKNKIQSIRNRGLDAPYERQSLSSRR